MQSFSPLEEMRTLSQGLRVCCNRAKVQRWEHGFWGRLGLQDSLNSWGTVDIVGVSTPGFSGSENAEKKLKSWVGSSPSWGKDSTKKQGEREPFSWHLPRVWAVTTCCYSAGSWAGTTVPFLLTQLLGLEALESQWTKKNNNPHKGTPKPKRGQVEPLE